MIPSGRAARAFFTVCALTLWLISPSPLLASHPYDDLLADLTLAVVRALGQDGDVRVISNDADLSRDVGGRLTERGVRVQSAAGAVVVAIACSTTLADRFCAAELRRAGGREVVSVRRAHDRAVPPAAAVPQVLQLYPLISNDQPILDVAVASSQLLVLHPSALARYEQTSDGWRMRDARAIVSTRPWPRDVRGRIVAGASKAEIFLPGVSCIALVDPLDLTCVETDRPWPIALENTGVAPAGNFFTSPEGDRYYAVAVLQPGDGARWLAARIDGQLVFLDDKRKPVTTDPVAADDVASIVTPCTPGSHVILSSRSSTAENGNALRLFRVEGRRLHEVTPPVALPGAVTALWANSGAPRATVVSYNAATGLYEAFQIGVPCNR